MTELAAPHPANPIIGCSRQMTALDIYPKIWADETDDLDTRERLQEGIEELKAFVREAATQGPSLSRAMARHE